MKIKKIEKRDYQQIAVKVILNWFHNHKEALMVMATGLGKMITAAIITKRWRGPGIFLVHDNGILGHAVEEFRRVYGKDYTFGVLNSCEKPNGRVDILFTTFQAMNNHAKQFSRDYFSWMVVDESHHGQARTFKKTIDRFICRKLAITATPDRSDLLDIRAIFGPEVVDIPIEEAIANGWLPQIEYHLITDNLNDRVLNELSRRVLDEGERVSMKEINSKIFISSRERKVAKLIKRRGGKAVIFCRRIAHANYFKRFLGGSADTYHSGQSREKNQSVMTALKTGSLRQMLAVNAFNEGIHVPDVDVVVFYRDTKSETVFRQQLGRGLHPGGKKLIVLDLVGNVQRITMINELAKAVVERARKKYPNGYDKHSFQIKGKGFNFLFSDQAVNLLKIMERIKVEFYPTWQEASSVVRVLGIKTVTEYHKRYKEAPRLLRHPDLVYADFPGWTVFLGGTPKKFYGTCRKASEATIAQGIKTVTEYKERYKEDMCLPSNPNEVYADFPGWNVFLGGTPKKFYGTCRKASEATIAQGIKTVTEYKERYKEDTCLPSNPNEVYADFPGWPKFLGKV